MQASRSQIERRMRQCLLSRLSQVECLLVGRLQAEDGTRENRSDDIVLGAKGWGEGGGRK